MGRKGMKSFLKGAHRPHAGSDDEAEAAEAAAAPAPAAAAAAAAAPAPAKPAERPAAGSDDDDDDEGDEGGAKGPETRGHMLQRHKREMLAHKKAMQKLGAKKKDEVAKLTADIEARHAKELREVEEREKAAAAAAAAAAPAAAAAAAEGVAALAVADGEDGADGHHRKPSKAQKRREKLAAAEAEREARIATEHAAQGPSDRAVEAEALRALLAPLKLGVREIRADGHCLYRSVEDQLSQATAAAASGSGSGPGPEPASGSGSGSAPQQHPQHDYLALRRLAASYIRSHAEDFSPFIYDEDAGGGPDEQLEAYCEELEGTAAWGGQLELGALAQALQRQVRVYAVGLPPVTLGDEHAGRGVVQLCYLRHAFGLGEHYNSVQPLAAGAADGA